VNEKVVPLFVNNNNVTVYKYKEKEKRSLLFGKEINYRNPTKKAKKSIASKQSKDKIK